jgi:hypothetical protein
LELSLELLNATEAFDVLTCIVILDEGGFFVKDLDDVEDIEQFSLIALQFATKQISYLE